MQCLSCYTDAPLLHQKQQTGVEAVLGAPATSHQPSSAEGFIEEREWQRWFLIWWAGVQVFKWILLLNITQPSSQFVLATSGYNPHPDITKVYGSQSPKPSFSWSRACVSVNKKRGFMLATFGSVLWWLTRLILFVGADCSYLCKCDWLVFGNVICIFACEHSTVTTIHLLWDFLRAKGE